MILGVGVEHVQSMKVLGVLKYNNFQQGKLGFNKKQTDGQIGLEERHPLKTFPTALWIISNRLVRHINLLLFLVTLSYPHELVTVVHLHSS